MTLAPFSWHCGTHLERNPQFIFCMAEDLVCQHGPKPECMESNPKHLKIMKGYLRFIVVLYLPFIIFISFIIESLYLNPKADETSELYFDIHLVSLSLVTFVFLVSQMWLLHFGISALIFSLIY